MEGKAAHALGQVTCPSGTLLVLDMGLLGEWSHDKAHEANPDLGMTGQRFVDLEVIGPDALRAASLVSGEAAIPLYDVPEAAYEALAERFSERAKAAGLLARLQKSSARVPHGQRVGRALAMGLRSGEVPFHVGNAIFLRDVPADRKLEVRGVRCGGDDDGRWSSVSLVFSEAPVARREKLGSVVVEQARLMFADLGALGAWVHEETLDGKEDIVFWGKDAEEFGAEPGITPLGDGQYGWLDVRRETLDDPTKKAIARVAQAAQNRRLCVDVRPHSHHYAVLKHIWSTPTESGSAEVGGATVCGFMTTWGDGVFDVFEELDADGRLAKVTIELGAEETSAGDDDEADEDAEVEEEEEVEETPERPASVPAEAVWKPGDREWELGDKREGHEVGPYVWWRPDGSVVCRSTYDEHGLLHGVCRRFHPDGAISMQAPYDAGKPHGKRFHTRSLGGDSPEDVHMRALPVRDAYRVEQLHVAGLGLPFATFYGKAGATPPDVSANGRIADLEAFCAAALPGTAFVVDGGRLVTLDAGEIDVPEWTPVVLRGIERGKLTVVIDRAAHTVALGSAGATLRLAVDALGALLGERIPDAKVGIMPDPSSVDGVLVRLVMQGGPASRAGVRPGDRIHRVLDLATPTLVHYVEALRQARPGSPLALIVRRGGEFAQVSIPLSA
jgi:PDZ domain